MLDVPALTRPFAAALIAGGRSRRMGQDKAWLEWQGRPLWQAQVEKLHSLRPACLLVACRAEQELQAADCGLRNPEIEWVFDPPGEDRGPLPAIVRCLERVQLPLLVLAVDMPWMTAAFLQEHVQAHLEHERALFFGSEETFEPVAALYVPEMLPLMLDALSDDQLSLQHIVRESVRRGFAISRRIHEEHRRCFASTNTMPDWVHEKGRLL